MSLSFQQERARYYRLIHSIKRHGESFWYRKEHSRIIHGDQFLRVALVDVDPMDELFVDVRVDGVHGKPLVVSVDELYQRVHQAGDGAEVLGLFLRCRCKCGYG